MLAVNWSWLAGSALAFQVASQVDSRTILDTKGADTLIGRGDLLFSPPGTSRLVRAQGAFVSDEEMQSLVEFLKVNGPPIYATDVQAQIDHQALADLALGLADPVVGVQRQAGDLDGDRLGGLLAILAELGGVVV